MLALLRKHSQIISSLLLVILLIELSSSPVFALTSGPSQPETQQFSPAGMDNMVDPFTGDFSYNIPLMDVGGYPININYASGITPDAEASWVGLGWNLNVGAINRSMRGLPDDFAGDEVIKEFNVKPNQTYGVTGNINWELWGAKTKDIGLNIGLNGNLFYNNYNGFGMSMGVSPSLSAGTHNKNGFSGSLGLSGTLGSESGLEVTPKIGISHKQTEGNNESTLGANLSFPFSTREGLKGMTLAASYSASQKYGDGNKDTKNDFGNGQSASGSAFQGFATPTYSPAIDHDMYNVNASLNLGFSFTNPLTENSFGFGGYYSGQFLKSTEKPAPAYGYMYSGLTQSDNKLMDFNREKDGGYNKFTTNLAVTNFTYDIFQVSGQGVGGTYRMHRGDVGSVHDPKAGDQGYSPSLGLDFGFGGPPSTKFALDGQFNYSQSSSGQWPSEKNGINNFNNENNLVNNSTELVYFKKVGEMAAENDNYFLNNVQNKYGVVRNNLAASSSYFGDGYLTGDNLVMKKNETTQANEIAVEKIESDNKRRERRIRTTSFTTLNVNEATNSAVLPIQNYEVNNFNWQYKDDNTRSATADNVSRGYINTEIARNSNGRKAHHISEVRVTDGSGARYVYGIPAYNTSQQEVTFAVPQGNATNANTGLISYVPGQDDVSGNNNGLDNYFNKVTTPAYAHSYLLTCVLSADYVDRDNIPGPSDGDLGTYTKFNYAKITDNFKWRTPFCTTPQASYTQGMIGNLDDDKGNYVYGEKEIWYLHSIETRTHVAEFYLGDRDDARGVAGTSGGIGSTKQKYLQKIVLYSKPDKWNSTSEAVKTVHFDYDYSLCPGTLNSQATGQGKLTLKKIWFTYGRSQKGILNPYVFTYADQNFDGVIDANLNPSYDFKSYDRWGNYKADNSSGLSNAAFPYALQDKTSADRNAAVYALSSIKTPTGGTMRVYYESDDYAYVQNKRAMRMFKTLGVCETSSDATYSNKLFDLLDPGQKLWLAVDLGEGFKPSATSITPDQINAEFRSKYLSGIDLMYYKALIKVINDPAKPRYEYVPGYVEINENSSIIYGTPDANGFYKQARIKIKSVGAKEGKSGGIRQVNPMIRNGWMYARLNLSRELSGSANANDSGLEQILRAMLSQARASVQFATGFVGMMILSQNSNEFKPAESFVRLNEPDKIKMGGGHRVKAIVMEDNWGLMKSSKETSAGSPNKETSFYGQMYDYLYNENGQTISAGVAAYEPILGNEENPFRRPVFTVEKVPLAPAKEYYLEEPFGESFFPSPTVGYRKVEVTPIKITGATINPTLLVGNGTGKVEHEFYTAYDFPSITRRTDLKTFRHKPNILFKFMKFDSRDLVTCSQGYYVELNDMHGKQKSNRVYPEYILNVDNTIATNKPISEVEYRYKLNTDGSLNNKVTYINPDLTVNNNGAELGNDIDVIQDQRHFESSTTGGGLQFNLKWVQVLLVPIIIPTFFPDFNHESTRFRSVVTTKVVNKYGILESTTAKDNGASITTRNLAYDNKTGQVLLTSVENEFHDPIYNFTFPGYWAYDRMGLASANEGLVFNSTGLSSLATIKDGDEVYLNGSTGNNVGYVNFNSGVRQLLNKDGDPVTGYSSAKVIRSGARNTSSIPVGTISCMANPIQSNGTLSFSKIINAGASEFQDYWLRFCNCPDIESDPNLTTNPYILGRKGNLRPFRSWTYLTERTQSTVNNNLNIRSDGFFKDFQPFWVYNTGSSTLAPNSGLASTKWQYVTRITKYNPLGMEIENKDALSRYSMAQFGYARNLPVATSNNSKYHETGYDGFEDYNFGDCNDDHFSWRIFMDNLTENEAHTGRKSIKVPMGGNVKINKVINPCENED